MLQLGLGLTDFRTSTKLPIWPNPVMNETEAPDTRPRRIKKKMKKSEPAAGPRKKTNQTKKKKKKKTDQILHQILF